MMYLKVPLCCFTGIQLRSSAETLGQMLTCALSAYAFYQAGFKGRDVLFIFTTLMIPGQVTMVPQ